MADISGLSATALQTLSSGFSTSSTSSIGKTDSENSFSTILSSAMDMISETNQLSNAAEETEIQFALGNVDSIHEVTVAQQKALVSLQYTVAVKNALLNAYNEIMNIQI